MPWYVLLTFISLFSQNYFFVICLEFQKKLLLVQVYVYALSVACVYFITLTLITVFYDYGYGLVYLIEACKSIKCVSLKWKYFLFCLFFFKSKYNHFVCLHLLYIFYCCIFDSVHDVFIHHSSFVGATLETKVIIDVEISWKIFSAIKVNMEFKVKITVKKSSFIVKSQISNLKIV